MSLSRLWWQQGKREEARQLLAEIYGRFSEGFDTAHLREAQQLLEASSEILAHQAADGGGRVTSHEGAAGWADNNRCEPLALGVEALMQDLTHFGEEINFDFAFCAHRCQHSLWLLFPCGGADRSPHRGTVGDRATVDEPLHRI
jgi:hypothetical protein